MHIQAFLQQSKEEGRKMQMTSNKIELVKSFLAI